MDQDDEGNPEIPLACSDVGSAPKAPARKDGLCDRATRLSASQPALLSEQSGAQASCNDKVNADKQNWQGGYNSVRDRNAVMFNNEMMADVHFCVGIAPNTLRIPAHKYVLATGSSVFYAMFYGMMATNGETKELARDIEIPDMEPNAFLNLLQ